MLQFLKEVILDQFWCQAAVKNLTGWNNISCWLDKDMRTLPSLVTLTGILSKLGPPLQSWFRCCYEKWYRIYNFTSLFCYMYFIFLWTYTCLALGLKIIYTFFLLWHAVYFLMMPFSLRNACFGGSMKYDIYVPLFYITESFLHQYLQTYFKKVSLACIITKLCLLKF